MTVQNDNSRSPYQGDGSTTVFATQFEFIAAADIVVILYDETTGISTTQVITTNYTVSGGSGANGNVTMVVAPAADELLFILRRVAITQTTNYVENDAFDAESHEDALDKLTMIAQQLKELLSRTPQVPVWSTAAVPDVDDVPHISRIFPAKLSSTADGDGTYAWVQVEPDASADTWSTLSGGANDTTYGRAREFEGCITNSSGDVVLMMLLADTANTVIAKFIVPGACPP
jgi:hypothetical protein